MNVSSAGRRVLAFGWMAIAAAAVIGGCRSEPVTEGPASESLASDTPARWSAISPGGETRCSDGSDYRFYVKPGDPSKLLVYLQGGGACWMRSNCDPAMSPTYTINVAGVHPARYGGIFDAGNEANPFSAHTMVFAPYCSADVHLGASDAVYEPITPDQGPLTIYHRGFANMAAVLDWTYEHVRDPQNIFVTGSSAGAIPSPYYAMKIADHYPRARVTQLGDGAGGYRRRDNRSAPHVRWGTLKVLRGEPGFEDLADDAFNYETLYIRAAKRRPDVQFAEYDAAEDAVQKEFLALGGSEVGSLIEALKANHADVRAEVDNFRSYIAGGDSHTILGRDEFYAYAADGRSVRDWVAEHASGARVGDVACRDCVLPEFVGAPIPDVLRSLWLQWEDPEQQSVTPFKIFDNLYYVGIDWVAAYLLVTSDGLILIDSLYGKWAREIPSKIKQLGFDPRDLKYVIVTHGHFDHAGGAARLQRRLGARVVMTAEDWALAAEPPDHPLFAMPVPAEDMVAEDGQVIELGDARVALYKTPGHTTGVLSMTYEVRDGDATHTAITLGGVGLNFSGVARTEQYLASYHRLQAMQAGISVSLPNHAAMGDVFERRDRLAARGAGDPHPFVDAAGYQQALTTFLANAQDKLAAEKAGNAPDPMAELTRVLDD